MIMNNNNPVNSLWVCCPTRLSVEHRHINLAARSLRRHHRRRRSRNSENTTISEPDQKLQMVIDKAPLSMSMKRLLKLNEFRQAFTDLQTLVVSKDSDQKVIICCQRSTIRFLGNLIIWGLLIGLVFRVLVKLGFRFRNGYGGGVVRRRDRSLGGREVVVGKSEFRVSATARASVPKNSPPRKEEKLPNWWPLSLSLPIVTVDKQDYQRKANGLIRAIMDYRMSGMDILEDDIIQLRRLCRVSGVRVFVEPANARDSFYRSSVDFILNICAGTSQSTDLHIDGESAREFIVGLADNIGVEKIRAARMVAAAVAARTRSWLLQAWALDIQGRYSEAVVELSKLCLIHKMFPPEQCSPEMEMVARGIEKHLKLEQRDYLIKMFVDVCGEESRRSVAEALGLVHPQQLYSKSSYKESLLSSTLYSLIIILHHLPDEQNFLNITVEQISFWTTKPK